MSILCIIVFNLKALLEKNFKKYFFFGFMVQASYVLLDASIGGFSGNPPFRLFAIDEFFNSGPAFDNICQGQ
jgi:formate hydrogenlyase subunit 3/multisubunit Na+/H+ antiporter MnhD subunit